MTRRCIRVAVVALWLLALAACKKEGAEMPADFGPRRPAVDVSKLQAPALFAHIPADTAFVMASFEAVPLEYYAKIRSMMGPAMERSLGQLRASAPDGDLGRWIDAIADELKGKWSAKGLESLGLSAQPRFAIYGHGVLPAVMRVEIKDGKALLATVERIAQRAGVTLPPLETRHGREFWRIELPREAGLVISIADQQLVVAIGPRHGIAAALPQILGAEKPARNMAGGDELKQLITKHKLGPTMIGYIDTKRVTLGALALAEQELPAACAAELDRVAAQVPRFVFSYTELTAQRFSFAAILELAAPLVEELKSLRAAVPGIAAALADRPIFGMGVGFDLGRGRTVGKSVAGALAKLGQACEAESLVKAADELREGMSKPIPGPLAKLTGGAFALDSIDFEPGSGGGGGGGGDFGPSMPRAVEGFAMVAASDAKSVFEGLTKELPPLGMVGVDADGKLHEVKLTDFGLPFNVHAGVGDQAMVVGAGKRGKSRAEKALNTSGKDKAPFIAGAMDFAKLMKLQAQLGQAAEIDTTVAEMMSNVTFGADATDAWLSFWMAGDLK
jgi:hypothetical protein